MTAHCYEIAEELHLKPISAEDAMEAGTRTNARIWVDLHAPEPDTLKVWLEALDVRGFTRQVFRDSLVRTGFIPLQEEVLLFIPSLSGTNEVDQLSFLCRENLLLSLHQKPLSLSLRQLATTAQTGPWLHERSIVGLISGMMNALSFECLQHSMQLRLSIITLEEEVELEPVHVKLEQILALRSELLKLDTVVSEQLPGVHGLAGTDRPFFQFKESQQVINCAMANLRSVDRAVDRLEKQINDIRTRVNLHTQQKTNRRLTFLTVLSAILMPMTLITGIYGMNFIYMPVLSNRLGFPITLSVMALIGLAMATYFWRKGWFR